MPDLKLKTNITSTQLDTDGDGQLTFDEFKVLFANADKRKKDSQTKLEREGQQPIKVMEATDKNIVNNILCIGQTSKKVRESLPAKFGRLSLGSKNPGGQGKEAAGRSRKMSIA